MESVTNVGLIECRTSLESFPPATLGESGGFRLKKVMVPNAPAEITKLHYPQSEIVQDKRAIIEDASIDLIVISGAGKSDLDLVAEVVQTGKHVRIV